MASVNSYALSQSLLIYLEYYFNEATFRESSDSLSQ